MRNVQLGHWRRWAFGVIVVLLAALAAPAQASDSGLEPARLTVTGWPRLAGPAIPGPSAGDGIGPGSYLLIDQTDGNSYICTANFVWSDGGKTFLGAAGHCFLPANVDAAPAGDPGHVYSTRVQVCVSACSFGGQLGAVIQGTFVNLGPVVYARQSLGGVDVGNDFGLVEIPSGTAGVRRSVPVWGGPSGTPEAPGLGQPVCLYGNAGGLGEVFATKARAGVGGLGDGGAWYASIPSAPGDSGAAVVNCPGLAGTTAAGILTHLATNGTGFIAGTTVAQAQKMVADDTGKAITVVNG